MIFEFVRLGCCPRTEFALLFCCSTESEVGSVIRRILLAQRLRYQHDAYVCSYKCVESAQLCCTRSVWHCLQCALCLFYGAMELEVISPFAQYWRSVPICSLYVACKRTNGCQQGLDVTMGSNTSALLHRTEMSCPLPPCQPCSPSTSILDAVSRTKVRHRVPPIFACCSATLPHTTCIQADVQVAALTARG